MEAKEQARFDTLYTRHLRALKLRGYSASTIDVYARAVRHLADHFDCVPYGLNIAIQGCCSRMRLARLSVFARQLPTWIVGTFRKQ